MYATAGSVLQKAFDGDTTLDDKREPARRAIGNPYFLSPESLGGRFCTGP